MTISRMFFYLKQAAGTLRVQDLEEIDQWFKERDAPEDIIK